MVNPKTWSAMAQGIPKNKEECQGSQSGIVSLEVISSPVPDCAMDKTVSSMSHERHLLLSWPRQGSESNWRQRGKICQKTTARGEEVERKAENVLSPAGGLGGKQAMRRAGAGPPPRPRNLTHPA